MDMHYYDVEVVGNIMEEETVALLNLSTLLIELHIAITLLLLL